MKQSKNTKNFTVHSKQTISISDHPLMVLCTVYCRLASGAFLHSKQTISIFRPPLNGAVYCVLSGGSCAPLRRNNAKLWGRVFFGIPFVFGSKMKMKQSKNAKNFTVHSKQTISISDLPLMVLCTVYCRLGSGAFLHKNEQCYCRPSFLLPFSPFGSRLHGALLRTGVARWRGRLRTDVSVLHGTALKWRHRCGAKRALRTLL